MKSTCRGCGKVINTMKPEPTFLCVSCREEAKLKPGAIVIAIGTKSLPHSFLGRYGKVTENHDEKVMVEWCAQTGGLGSLAHTAYPEDLKKVGESIG